MALFANKYRIASARMSSWDYGSNAAYFVTICTHHRLPSFGKVVDAKMQLSLLGIAADNCWKTIPEHFPFVITGTYVIMPDHIHGIIIINKPYAKETQNIVETQNVVVETQNFIETQNVVVETQNFASLQRGRNVFGPQSRNLGSIIRGFKIGVTKFAKENNIDFKWQPRFYDRIIRNEQEYNSVCNYILANPAKWQHDLPSR